MVDRETCLVGALHCSVVLLSVNVDLSVYCIVQGEMSCGRLWKCFIAFCLGHI